MEEMTALSLWQPWATLVAAGQKLYETRDWGTPFRGPLAIHATGTFPASARGLCAWPVFRLAVAGAGFATPADLPRGAVVAVAELVACRRVVRWDPAARVVGWDDGTHQTLPAEEAAFGDYTPGRYGWQLARIRRLPTPVPAKGHQRLWRWPVPAELEAWLTSDQ